MPAPFRFTTVRQMQNWNNWHGTIQNTAIAEYLVPGQAAAPGVPAPSTLQRQAQGLTDIFQHCLATGERLTTVGATWSLSDVLSPGNVVVDPEMFNRMVPVDPAMWTAGYQARRRGTPIFAQAGMHIWELNDALGGAGLALDTSGAGNGHRLAGCIATGTHGAAFRFGAVHDQVRAIFLVTGPQQAVLLQPDGPAGQDRNFTPALAAWFQQQTGLPTLDDPNDERFNAALVALGGLGFVHSVVLEAAPLYELEGQMIPMQLGDPRLWDAIRTFDVGPIALPNAPAGPPWHFEVLLNAYANDQRPTGAFVKVFWRDPNGPPQRAYAPGGPNVSMMRSDLSRVVAAMFPLANIVPGPLLDLAISGIVDGQFTAGNIGPFFPSELFGQTALPRGNGRSTEVVFDHLQAEQGIRALIGALRAEAAAGRHLFGAVGVRFVPRTRALLGMNQRAQNVFVELGSLATAFPGQIHQACWQALRNAGVPFTCHWGQQSDLAPIDVINWYGGANVAAWQNARANLLPTPQLRALFTNPLLQRVGLI